jgi:type III secretion system FlhB-like substrate exporter
LKKHKKTLFQGEKNMKNFTPELIAKAKAAKSAEELLELAKANNVELSETEAKTYFAQLNANGAVSDDELDVVAGGLGCPDDGEESEANAQLIAGKAVRVINGKICPKCHSNEGVIGQNFAANSVINSSKYVFCNKCNLKITEDVTSDTVELI